MKELRPCTTKTHSFSVFRYVSCTELIVSS